MLRLPRIEDVAHPRQQRIDPAKVQRSMKGRGAPAAPRKATASDWIAGARLRTLPLSIAPVALGAAAASVEPSGFDLVLSVLCLAVAVLLQIGVNYANDYSDGVRGTDKYRVGPSRLTGSGAAKPRAVLQRCARLPRPRRARRRRGDRAQPALVAVRGRGRRPGRRVVLHRRQASLRLPRARRTGRLRLLRDRRHRRHHLRADRHREHRILARRHRGRFLRCGRDAGEQPARPRAGCPCRKTQSRRDDRGPGLANPVHGVPCAALRHPGVLRGVLRLGAVRVLHVVDHGADDPDRADREDREPNSSSRSSWPA